MKRRVLNAAVGWLLLVLFIVGVCTKAFVVEVVMLAGIGVALLSVLVVATFDYVRGDRK